MGDFLDASARGVDADIVVTAVTPALTGKELIVLRAVFVHGPDHLLQIFLDDQLRIVAAFCLTALDLGLRVGVDKDTEGPLFVKDVVGAATHDDAVGAVGGLVNNIALLTEDFLILGPDWVAQQHERAACMDGEGVAGVTLAQVLNILLRQLRPVGNLTHDLLVVICPAKLFGQTFAQLTSTTAEFSADGYDFIHE